MRNSKAAARAGIAGRILVGLVCLLAAAGIHQAAAQTNGERPTNEQCLGCHGTEGFGIPGQDGKMRSLHVIKDKFQNSVHGKRLCVECHQNINGIPHAKVEVRVSCVQCHQSLWSAAQSENKTKENAKLGTVVEQIERYMKSIHARPNMQDQSRTNATCYACHDAHYVYPLGTTVRAEWRLNIPDTCGKCHPDQRALYATSVHGKEVLEKRNPVAAICSDCHTTHDIEDPAMATTRLAITKNCGNCHFENLKSYTQTYHGQVHTLGYAHTAKCFDCHGSHTVQRVNDPSSRVHPDRRVQTCRNCHENATAGFATFQPHATTNDFNRYPHTWLASKFMIALLGGTFAFFWTHSALWLYREYRDMQQHKKRPHVRTDELLSGDERYYRRWGALWRLTHLVFALAVMTLVFTGMTLFWAETAWARLAQKAFGGPWVTGSLHRVAAAIFLGIFFGHILYVIFNIARHWKTFQWFGPHSLIPNWQDLKDVIAMFKWFFGMSPRPVFDRWSYWEKFDYWAPFWGVTIIGTSGLMLAMPNLTATYLPGWVFNVATIFHGEEAILAAGFLFTVHFFNNHWRPDNFPLETMMFTGVMPLEKFKREHTVEYRRLVESGELSKYIVDAPSRSMTVGSKILGFALIAIGLLLLILILIGFLGGLNSHG